MGDRSERPSIDRRRFIADSALGAAALALGRSFARQDRAEAAVPDGYAVLDGPNTFTADNAFRSGRPWADVRAFGASGDGTADDTSALQSAIDSIGVRGGLVLVPQGTYRVTAPLVLRGDYMTLRGIGRGSEIFAGPGWAGGGMLVSAGWRGIRIEHLWLDGQDGRAGLAIDMVPPSGVEAHNWIQDNHISGCRSGIRIGSGAFGCHVLRNSISTSGTIADSRRGIDLQGPDNMVAFNRVTNFQEAGIHLGAGGQQIVGNHIYAFARTFSAPPYPTAIRLTGGGLQVIEGNYLDNVRQNAMILIEPSAGRPVHRVLIQGNTFIAETAMRNRLDTGGASYPAIQIEDGLAAVSGVHIGGNLGMASAATPFSFILRQTPSVSQTVLVDNEMNECMGWWDHPPRRFGGNTISVGTSYRRGLTEARSGLVLKTKAGRVSDADFEQPPPDGTIAVDSRNHRICVRVGGKWRSVSLV